jgi:hypothetical protein
MTVSQIVFDQSAMATAGLQVKSPDPPGVIFPTMATRAAVPVGRRSRQQRSRGSKGWQ